MGGGGGLGGITYLQESLMGGSHTSRKPGGGGDPISAGNLDVGDPIPPGNLDGEGRSHICTKPRWGEGSHICRKPRFGIPYLQET